VNTSLQLPTDPPPLALAEHRTRPAAAPAAELERLVRLACRFLAAPAAAVVVMNPEGESSAVVAGPNGAAGALGTALSLPAFGALVVEAGELQVIADVHEQPGWRDLPALRAAGVVTLLAIPLRTPAGGAFGAFCVVDTRQRAWASPEVELLVELAARALAHLVPWPGPPAGERVRSEHRERLGEALAATDCLVWQAEVTLTPADWKWDFAELSTGLYRRMGGEWRPSPGAGSWHRFGSPDQAAMDRIARVALAAGLAEYTGDFRVIQAGDVRWLSETVQVTRLEAGRFRLVGMVVEVTAMKTTAEQARASALELSRQKFALDQHAIVAVTDVHGVITYVNDKFCAISRYSRAELLGQNHRVINSGCHGQGFFAAMYRTIARGDVWEGEICNRTKDGSLYWVATTIVPFLGPSGKPTSYVAIRADITARKQLEESLRHARDHALAASRFKSEFLAAMSHEIRTPMNAIIGMVGLLADTTLTAEQTEMTRTISGGAESLLVIINDILDFSRIEAGQLRLDPAEFDFQRVVEETVALLAGPARGKGLEVTCVFGSGALPRLLGDGGRVRQLLVNLLGNAIKFTEAGEVAVTVHTLADSAERVRLRVNVRDTGVGIPPEVQDRLFQPFTQAEGGASRRFGGSGLGLAISRRLIELMGGAIGFESKLNQGSTFWFELELPRCGPVCFPRSPALLLRARPTRSDAARGAGEMQPDLDSGRGRRLLLAEDNAANQRVAAMLLAKLGYAVVTVADGEQALMRLDGEAFDGVLMDCQMPRLDGYATTRQIRAGVVPGLNPRIPIIALTAYARPDDHVRCREAGMDDYVSKPIRPDKLRAALERCGLEPAVVGRRDEPEKSEPVLDAEALEIARGLPGLQGASLLPELVELYLSDETLRLRRLEQLALDRQGVALADAAHALGGNAAAFGGVEVRRAALALEAAARVDGWPEVAVQLPHLRAACARLRHEVARLNVGSP